MNLKFKIGLIGLFALLLLGNKNFAQSVDYSYAVVGCNRVDYTDTSATTGTSLATGPSTANVYQLNRLFTEVSQLNPLPKYLFLAGDMVMGYISDTVELEKQLTKWKQIYNQHPISTMPIQVVVIPGNHETQDKAAGKKSFVAAERTFLRAMAPFIAGSNGPGIGGPDNLATDQSKLTYSFNYGLDHFVIVDTDPVGQDGRVPYKWVANDIKNARVNGARHIFTIGHKPAYASPLKPLDGLESFIPQRDSLWKHLENNQCEAMFAAHNHLWDTVHPHAGKTWQVIAGNGGSRVETSWMGAGQSYFGFTLVNIYKNNQVNVKSFGRDADMTKLSLNEDANPTTVRADFNIGISPVIDHTPLTSNAGLGPFSVVANITDDIAVTSAQLNYSVNGMAQSPVAPSIAGNTYTFTIPAQAVFGTMSYNIQASDASGVKFYSTGSASAFHQFSFGTEGPSSSQTSYLNPTKSGSAFRAILTAGDVIGGYKMEGTPDGLGVFDNGNGTFTLLSNHEFVNTVGIPRAHGSKGSFVSKWIINKSDLSVVSGSDLIQNVNLWNGSGYTTYNASNPSTLTAFSRFCSADLPAVSAYYNNATGLGTKERIFMDGEESGSEGRMFAHIATGPNSGTSYELPALGKFSIENAVANSATGDKTVVAGMDDSTPGQVYLYIGTKTNAGTEIDKAGLTNGKLYGVSVSGMLTETSAVVPAPGTSFSLVDLGDVKGISGATLNTNSNNLGVTTFLRPEDGAWDPSNPRDLYFNTTNAITSPSRLWRLHFSDISNPQLGGTIEAVLDGTEGQKMLDNMTIDNSGHILLLEDVGNDAHIGAVWQYTIATDVLTKVGEHDPSRFLAGGANFITQDEETSGIIDAQSVLGSGMFLLDVQAHNPVGGEQVEGGQFLAYYNPDTYSSNPEVAVFGNSVNIANGDTLPSTADNTDFGTVTTGSTSVKTFAITNSGLGSLVVNSVSFTGTNSNEFSLVSGPSFPVNIPSGGSQNISVKFSPSFTGVHTASINIGNNDADEGAYLFALKGSACTPPMNEIITDGSSRTKCQGDSIVLSASEEIGLSYQWLKNGVEISGATNQMYTVKTTGSYTVKLTSSLGCSSVSAVSIDITVNPAPQIVAQPLQATVCEGADATYTVSATGTGLKYQWQEYSGSGAFHNVSNGAVFHNVTTPTLTIVNVPASYNARKYRCYVSGTCAPGVYSAGKPLVVKTVTIAQQPANTYTCYNTKAYFSVKATGSGVLYQWQKRTYFGTFENLVNAGVYQNVNTAKLTINGAKYSLHNNFFRCVLTTNCSPLVHYTAEANLMVYNCAAKNGSDEEAENNSMEAAVSVFPNPASDEVKIEFNLPNDGVYNWELLNSLGVKMTSGKAEGKNTKTTLSVANYPGGIYFISVSKDDVGKDYKKLLIVH